MAQARHPGYSTDMTQYGAIAAHPIYTGLRGEPDARDGSIRRLREALDGHGGSISLTAEALGISRKQLHKWLVDLPELSDRAARTREARGEAGERMAKARAAPRKKAMPKEST